MINILFSSKTSLLLIMHLKTCSVVFEIQSFLDYAVLLLYAFFFITIVIYFRFSYFFHFYLNTSSAFVTVINSQKLYWVCCKVNKYRVFYCIYNFLFLKQASRLAFASSLWIVSCFLHHVCGFQLWTQIQALLCKNVFCNTDFASVVHFKLSLHFSKEKKS